MNKKKALDEISHLLLRQAQTPLVSSLIKGFAREFGKEKAFKTAMDVICRDAALAGKSLAEKYSDNSLETMLRIVTEVWAKDGTMEIENISLSSKRLSFDVTSCGYAKLYDKLGVKDMGTLLSCCRDFAFMDGFNPEIKLVRTKTIMEGDDICNFCYKME